MRAVLSGLLPGRYATRRRHGWPADGGGWRRVYTWTCGPLMVVLVAAFVTGSWVG